MSRNKILWSLGNFEHLDNGCERVSVAPSCHGRCLCRAHAREVSPLQKLFLALLLADRDRVVLALLAERLGVKDAAHTAP